MYSSFTSEKSFYEGEARVRLRNIKKNPKDSTPKKQQQTTRVHKVLISVAKVKDCGRDWLESNFNNFLKWLLIIFVQKY